MRKEKQSSTKTAEGKLQQVVAEKDGDVIFGKISAVGVCCMLYINYIAVLEL